MTERLFELRQSNKLAAKILVAFFVIALAMVMAFAPPVETVALANEVNQVCAAVGAKVSTHFITTAAKCASVHKSQTRSLICL